MRHHNGNFDPSRRDTLAAGLAILLGGAATRAWGAEVTLTPNLTGFSRVEASSAFEVEIRQGGAYRVEVRADDDVADHLEVRTDGNRLRLGLRQGSWLDRWRGTGRMYATVTMPDLTAFHGSGATRAHITGFRSSSPFEVHLSGASRVEADIDAGDVELHLSGASRVDLAGRGSNLRIDASGASKADLSRFNTSSAHLNLSGASNMDINTSGRLDVDASGASKVYYAGRPLMGRIETSGGSSIRSRN
jgi:hypothetical protein